MPFNLQPDPLAGRGNVGQAQPRDDKNRANFYDGKVGGMDLFASLIAKMTTAYTVTMVAGFWAGLVSAYASTTGVILPAFLPMAKPLLQQVGGTDLMALVSSIIVCGFVVDLSPLSTTGAVFIANAGPHADKNRLFRNMLIWGLSMSVVGAVASWLAFTVLRLPWGERPRASGLRGTSTGGFPSRREVCYRPPPSPPQGRLTAVKRSPG